MNLDSNIVRIRERGFFRYFLYTFVILIIIFFLIRNSIVQFIFDIKCASIKNRYGLLINADKVGFSGIRTLYADNLTVKPIDRDTLLCITRAEVRFDFTDLFFLKANPLEIWLNNSRITLVGDKVRSNYSFIFDKHKNSFQAQNPSNDENSIMNHQNTIYRFVKAIFGLTTAKYHVNQFLFSYTDSAYTTQISIPRFESSTKGFETKIEVNENGDRYFINLNGLADKSKSNLTLNAIMIGDKKPLPLLSHKLGLKVMFDSLNLRVTAKELHRNDIELSLIASVKSLNLFSARLSDQNVKVQQGGFKFDITINPDYYLIDSSSTVDLNGLKANLFLKYSISDERALTFKINTGAFQSQQLFDALPEGLFSNLKGIKTNGSIDFGLDFNVKLDKPDSIYLNPILTTKGFSIARYGSRNFNALNDTFSHDIYDEGEFIESIHLGYKNKDFRAFNQISPLIIDAIVTSEDGGFFNNNGFDIEAFKYAVSENLKQNRFVRGGSTITMQLVKNLYLNKNKNLFRKAEEYLIVWLIGSQGIVAKERMLEIYLNIIEWGPNVYGVNEACHYYFDKDPKIVTLDEAIFLASVIPRPKKFKYLFEKDGNLKSFMETDFNFVADKMLQRGMISEEQFNSLVYNVKLTGPAKEMLIDTSLFPLDSISIDEIRLNRDTTLLLP
ncbi:MAG: hypothetical protein EHM93_12665 [Bacteroidales bacterium]|nr:MAG: hypothetical protein EHM93_12665 [Bacteroidales bacterium]